MAGINFIQKNVSSKYFNRASHTREIFEAIEILTDFILIDDINDDIYEYK